MCSIVEYYGDFGKSKCGYCKGEKTASSAGMTAHFLSVEDYQDLIDRGWRRSGKYCYKPSNSTTCCPSYTIKCDLNGFALSKSHKKILKTMNKFLRDGIRDKTDSVEEVEAGGDGVEKEYLLGATRDLPAVYVPTVEGCSHQSEKPTTPGEKSPPGDKRPSPTIENQEGTGNLKKKKQMRLERRQAKLVAKGLPVETASKPCGSAKKSLEDFLNEEPKDGKHKLKVNLVPSDSESAKASYALYTLYQMSVHRDPPSKLKRESYLRFLCKSPLKVQLVLSSTKEFKGKHGATEYDLYRKYQLAIHNDKVENISEFYNFLVDSPLKPEDTGTDYKLGSFHQQYWLDDKLIAVGVIDLLPKCLSSVYFFYDPAYKFLSLGTYGSLRELAFVREVQKELPDIHHYYMGFYIHSCPKMRYKARLSASYLLCPEVYTWHAIDEALLKRLDESKYSRFNPDANAKDGNAATQDDLKRIPMYNGGKPMLLEQYLRKCDDRTVFGKAHEYAKYVGAKCARRIVLYL